MFSLSLNLNYNTIISIQRGIVNPPCKSLIYKEKVN
jgi:hypothetical protein